MYSPDLRSMNFRIWKILESKGSLINLESIEVLKRTLVRGCGTTFSRVSFEPHVYCVHQRAVILKKRRLFLITTFWCIRCNAIVNTIRYPFLHNPLVVLIIDIVAMKYFSENWEIFAILFVITCSLYIKCKVQYTDGCVSRCFATVLLAFPTPSIDAFYIIHSNLHTRAHISRSR